MSTSPLRPSALSRAALALLPLLLAAAPFVAACGDDRVQTFEEPPPPEPRCGDEERNGEEQCEGEDLGGATCQSQGFIAGTLSCASDCRFDTSKCVRTCGNGTIDFGEECDGANLNGESCGEWGTLSCGADCRMVRTGCVSSPMKEAQRLDFLTLAFAGFGPREMNRAPNTELWVTQPSAGRIDLLAWNGDLLFDAQKKRVFAFDSSGGGSPTAIGDLNGDAQSDGLVRVTGATKFTLALSKPDGFEVAAGGAKPSLELGCEPLAPHFVDLDGDADLDVVAPACLNGGILAGEARILRNRKGSAAPQLEQAGSVTLDEPASYFAVADADRDQKADLLAHVPSKKAIALWKGNGALSFGTAQAGLLADGEVAGDFAPLDADQDGDLDLLVVDALAKELSLLVNKGDGTFTRKPAYSGLTALRLLTVLDVDLDGWLDVALVDGASLVVVQNSRGSFDQRRATYPLGDHDAANLSFGDADQDGDPDLATGGMNEGSGRGEVVLFRNQVR